MDQTDLWLRYVAVLTPGMTQDEISKKAGVSQGTISRWINGRKLPTEAAKVAAFARGFNRNVLEAFVVAGMITLHEAERGLDSEARAFLRNEIFYSIAQELAGEDAEEEQLWTLEDVEQFLDDRRNRPVADPATGSGGFLVAIADRVRDQLGDDWTELERMGRDGHREIVRGFSGRRWRQAQRERIDELTAAARADTELLRHIADVYAGALEWLDGVFEAVEEAVPNTARGDLYRTAGDYLRDGLAHEQYTESEYVVLRLVLDQLQAELYGGQASAG